MLEGLVAWVLNNYLGKYVENLNTDQLSIALLSGKVELENLPLKKDALRHLGLPVEVKAGFIGKVQLQIPVRQIRSAPWVIAIEKLYLVAAPVNLDEWDSEAEAHHAHERKVALLDALEAQWRAEHEASDAGYYATSYSSWLSYGTGLLANIVENLQLKIIDVHLRYEDTVTCGRAFACGLTAQSLAAESCDASWKKWFSLLPDPEGRSHKLLELQQLALYWDPISTPSAMLAELGIAELTERMRETWRAGHAYVLAPTSARARVCRERTEQPLRCRERPRLACQLTLDTVLLNLTSRQYSEAVGCALGLERIGRVREFRALRPSVPVKGHVRDWWIYALSCHMPHNRWRHPRPSWAACAGRARAACAYVRVCLQLVTSPAAALPPADKAAKDDFEWNTPLHVLKPLREIAMRSVPKTTPVSSPDRPSSGRSMLVHWFPQWWGWYSSPAVSTDTTTTPVTAPSTPTPSTPTPIPAPTSAPAELEEEILDVIADSLENNTLLKKDMVFGKFDFVLNKGSFNLLMDSEDGEESGVELEFVCVRVQTEWRPRGGAAGVHVSLGSLCLTERITPGTLFPVVCAPQGVIRSGLSSLGGASAGYAGSGASWCRAHAAPAPPAPPAHSEPLFQLAYEKKPIGLNCDYKLWVKSASLEVVYCEALARWAQRFARRGWDARLALDSTRATLINHFEHMVHAHSSERSSWHVELDIWAPQILLVEQLCSRDSALLLVDFGRLRLANANQDLTHHAPADDEEMFMTPCSTPPGSLLSPASPEPPAPPGDRPPGPSALHPDTLYDSIYDRYKIELSELQILVGRVRDNWKYAHTKTTSSLHLLDRFSISLQAERRVLETSDPVYPRAALCGSLPALVAHLTEHKLCALRAVLAPLRSEDAPAPQASPATEDDDEASVRSETDRSESSSHNNSTIFMLQFAVDQMSLEVTHINL